MLNFLFTFRALPPHSEKENGTAMSLLDAIQLPGFGHYKILINK